MLDIKVPEGTSPRVLAVAVSKLDGFTPAARFLLVAGAFVVVSAGLKSASALVTPFLLAVFIAVLVAPPLSYLRSHGLPGWVAMLVMIALLVGVGGIVVALFTNSLNQFNASLPDYQLRLKTLSGELITWIDLQGVHISREVLPSCLGRRSRQGRLRAKMQSEHRLLTARLKPTVKALPSSCSTCPWVNACATHGGAAKRTSQVMRSSRRGGIVYGWTRALDVTARVVHRARDGAAVVTQPSQWRVSLPAPAVSDRRSGSRPRFAAPTLVAMRRWIFCQLPRSLPPMTDAASSIPLTWQVAVSGGIGDALSEHNRAVVDEIARLIKADDRDTVITALRRWPPASVLDLFVHLPLKRARRLVSWMDEHQTRIVAELNPVFRAALLQDATLQRLVDVFNGMEPEEIAAALDDLPEEVVLQVLPELRERQAVDALRGYADESAASIMSHKFVAVPPDWTIGQVTRTIRENSGAIEKLYAVNVVDAEHRPVGYLRLRDLLLLPKDTPVHQAMHRDFVAVGPDTDQEQVARIAERYELSVVPVVDVEGRLIGRITPQQLHRVLREEAEEDLNLMSGLPADTRPDDSIGRIVRGRVPWLLIGLAGASVSAAVVGAFEDQLAKAAILASFIPIVMSMAGNAGIQASTVAVQGLSTGTVTFGDLGWRLSKELVGALANGAIAATVLALLVMIVAQVADFDAPLVLALTAGLSLLSVVIVAVGVGATIPILLDRLGIDPAMATGVFITTGNDILSVAIFFTMMTLFYL